MSQEDKKLVIRFEVSEVMLPDLYKRLESMPAKYRAEKLRHLANIGEMIESEAMKLGYLIHLSASGGNRNHTNSNDDIKSRKDVEGSTQFEISKEELMDDLKSFGIN